MYADHTIDIGARFLGIEDRETIESILEGNKANRAYFKSLEDEWNKLIVPRGLSKREYRAMLRDAQIDIDRMKRRINEAPFEERMSLRLDQQDLIMRKERITLFMNTKHVDRKLDIAKAREYPISQLVTFKGGFAKCPFHEEKHGSMRHYRKDNVAYCFSCSKQFDAIDLYQRLHNADFNAAVRALS